MTKYFIALSKRKLLTFHSSKGEIFYFDGIRTINLFEFENSIKLKKTIQPINKSVSNITEVEDCLSLGFEILAEYDKYPTYVDVKRFVRNYPELFL